jgi:hypothetical protein
MCTEDEQFTFLTVREDIEKINERIFEMTKKTIYISDKLDSIAEKLRVVQIDLEMTDRKIDDLRYELKRDMKFIKDQLSPARLTFNFYQAFAMGALLKTFLKKLSIHKIGEQLGSILKGIHS